MKSKHRAKTNRTACSFLHVGSRVVFWRLVSSVTETVWAQCKPWSADVWPVNLRQCGHGWQWIRRYGQARQERFSEPHLESKMKTWERERIRLLDICLLCNSLGFWLSFSCNSSAKTRDRGILFTAFHSWHLDLPSMMVKVVCALFWICRCKEFCH